MNKRGWLRVVEAFIAILLVASALLIVINQGYTGREDISKRVYDTQLLVLREIELDSELREDILESGDAFPIYWSDFTGDLENVKDRIENRIPEYLNCRAVICALDEICEMDEYLTQDVYAQSVAIAATEQIYSPRQLKMFCWTD